MMLVKPTKHYQDTHAVGEAKNPRSDQTNFLIEFQ